MCVCARACICVFVSAGTWVFTTRGLIFALPHRDNTSLEKESQQSGAEWAACCTAEGLREEISSNQQRELTSCDPISRESWHPGALQFKGYSLVMKRQKNKMIKDAKWVWRYKNQFHKGLLPYNVWQLNSTSGSISWTGSNLGDWNAS